MTMFTAVWMRLAGYALNIKSGNTYCWRIIVDGALPEIPLVSWRVIGGIPSSKNIVPGTNPTGEKPLGLYAWIDFYEDVVVMDDDIAEITLR